MESSAIDGTHPDLACCFRFHHPFWGYYLTLFAVSVDGLDRFVSFSLCVCVCVCIYIFLSVHVHMSGVQARIYEVT